MGLLELTVNLFHKVTESIENYLQVIQRLQSFIWSRFKENWGGGFVFEKKVNIQTVGEDVTFLGDFGNGHIVTREIDRFVSGFCTGFGATETFMGWAAIWIFLT